MTFTALDFSFMAASAIYALVAVKGITQLTFTCSKLTVKSVEKGVKYVQS